MFRCESCGKTTNPGEKCHKFVVKTRPKRYKNTIKKGKKVEVIESHGTEIVQEINMCDDCHRS